jgi:hypothetical protein
MSSYIDFLNLITGTIMSEQKNHSSSYLGDPTVLEFMKTRLVDPIEHPEIYDPDVFPMKNSLMLFGKDGAGKRTLVEEYYNKFDQVDGFVLQEYNLGDFCGWCDKITASFTQEDDNTRRIILVENVHLMAYCKGTMPEQQMMKLMVHVRARSRLHGRRVFLITTCSEGPLRINDTLVRLVDYMCYVPPPSDEHRMILFHRFIENWVNLAKGSGCYNKMDVDLDEDDYALLSLVSKNTVPGDIWKFCQRCFDAISYPDVDCAFGGDLINKILYSTNKGKSIIQGVPEDELQMFAMYITGSKKKAPPTEEERVPSAAEALVARRERMSKKQKTSDKGKEEEEEEEEEEMVVGTPEWPPVTGDQAWIVADNTGDHSKRHRDDEERWAAFENETKKGRKE